MPELVHIRFEDAKPNEIKLPLPSAQDRNAVIRLFRSGATWIRDKGGTEGQIAAYRKALASRGYRVRASKSA